MANRCTHRAFSLCIVHSALCIGLSFAPMARAALPTGFSQLKSITSTGTQYIKTGMVPTSATTVEMDFNTGPYNADTTFFGQSWTTSQYLFIKQNNVYKFYDSGKQVSPLHNNTDAHLSITADNKLILDFGDTAVTTTVSRTTSSAAFNIFADSGGGHKGSWTLYSLKIWTGGVPMRDFVPALRLSDNAVGLYDLVGGTFYQNAGSGSFTAGDIVFSEDMLEVGCTAAENCATPSPAYGVMEGLAAGQTLAVSCGATPWTNAAETVVYSCTGWKLYDRDGNVLSTGPETSFTYTHPTPAAWRRLEWQWTQNAVKGVVATGSGGSVSPSGSAWYAIGTPVTVTATPDANNTFYRWTGTLPAGIDTASASVTFTPSAPFDMAAAFGCIYRVDKLVADGTDGSGASWADPISLSGAFAAAVDGDSIWIKAGTYTLGSTPTLANAAAITVRGGFTGGAVDDERADGAVSILFGNAANTADPVMNFTAAAGAVTLERVEFVKIKRHALYKSGAADIVVSGCRFLHCNTDNADTGKVALNFTGTASAKAVITNCVFEANRFGGNTYTYQQGYTTWFSTFSSVEISDSLFATNGLTFTTSTHYGGRESMKGSVIYSTAAPLKVERCAFRGNIYMTHSSENSGGMIWLAGNATGHAFRNCLFAGNRGTSMSNPNTTGRAPGVIFVQLNDKAQTVAVENCTFAYNTGYPAPDVCVAAGITVSKGALTCRNSIFHGNVIYSTSLASADINLKTANASADIDWCMFDSLGAANVSAGLGTLTLGVHNVTGDPLLGTSTEEFRTNGLSQSYSTLPATVADSTPLYIKQGFYNAIGSYDFHLLSRAGRYRTTSWGVGDWVQDNVNAPAIDAGDPAAVYAREPANANGGRLNLGAYGNTPQASKTEPFAPAIASVAVDTSSDYTQPHFATTLGGSGTYRADVYCCLGASSGGAGTNGWDTVALSASGALIGDVVDARPCAYLDAGETYWYKIVMVCNGAVADETQSAQVTIPAGASRPPWDGHGGDATKVIHFRPGAVGRGDGSSWSDACTDIDSALALLTAERNEIWMAGDAGSEMAIILQPSFAVTLRGGFDGSEDAAADRAAGLRSDLDGEKVREVLLAIGNQAGAPIVIERFSLHHARTRAVEKTGTGDVAFIDCDFASNCWRTATASAVLYGYGVKATGGSAATLAFTNCTFTGNTSHGNGTADNNATRGAAAYLESLRTAFFDNCVFSCNGIENQGADRDDSLGSVLHATGAPVVCTRTKFLGGLATSNGNNSGAVIYLTGAGGGSSFRNCAFLGNGATGWQTGSTPTLGRGLFTVNFNNATAAISFDNCTFAYNFTDNDRHPAGLEIVKGAVTVRNSIFYGNANRGTAGTSGKDILLVGNETVSTLDIDYTMLTADNAASLSLATPAALAMGDHMLYGDPAFVSTPDDFMATLNNGSGFTNSVSKTSFKSRAAAAALNVHLRGGEYAYTDEVTGEACVVPMPEGSARDRSPAIDTGDPSAPVAGEAEPNGGVVNLGAYGGTPYATRSPVGRAEIASATVNQTSDGTQPHIAVALGGSGMYSATVVTCMGATDCGSNLAGWDYVKTNSISAINGDVVDGYVGNYFVQGQPLCWRVFVIDANGNVATEAGALTVTGTPAPFQGHGGGAGVVHVRPGATGRGDGTSWQDAVGTFAEGEALMTAQRNELWVATPSIERSDIAMSHTFAFSAALRGGFAGTEDSPDDRADGSMTLIDGLYDSARNYCLEVANGTGVAVEIDGFHFDRGYWRAFNKTGYGDIAFRNCRMSRSAPERSCRGTSDARTMYFDGGGTAAVSFENCVFDGNIGTAEVNYYSVGVTGLGFANLRSLSMESCLFTSNGTAFASNLGREGFEASCLYVSGTPATVENCRFIANHTVNHSYVTAHVRLEGAGCAGSSFRNCLFAANGATIYTTAHNGGVAVYANLAAAANTVGFENCTFAYNYTQCKWPSGLYVNAGKATVTNCIFHANVTASGSTYPADIYVKSGATCEMDYTLLGGTDTAHVSAAALPADTSHLVIGDPLFISPTSAFLATMNAAAYPVADVAKPKFNTATDRGVAAGFNYHLSGAVHCDERTGEQVRTKNAPVSPAVDAGDPSSPYGNEPRPHGRRVNLGFYGNTPWATSARLNAGTTIIMR